MPYRSRPIDWNLLLQPSIEASRIKEREDARKRQERGGIVKLIRGVAGAAIGGPVGGFVGGGFQGLVGAMGRQESARRFDATHRISQQNADTRTAGEARVRKAKLDNDAAISRDADALHASLTPVIEDLRAGGAIDSQKVAPIIQRMKDPAAQKAAQVLKRRVTGEVPQPCEADGT